MVQEELGKVAEVLTVNLLLLAIDLEHGHIAIAVDLISRRVLYLALSDVFQHVLSLLEEHEVKLGEEQLLQASTQHTCAASVHDA